MIIVINRLQTLISTVSGEEDPEEFQNGLRTRCFCQITLHSFRNVSCFLQTMTSDRILNSVNLKLSNYVFYIFCT